MQLDLASSGEAVPEISSVRPLAVTPSYQGPILVTGRHVGGEGDTVYCRNGGECCPAGCQPCKRLVRTRVMPVRLCCAPS
jgi:hypothetical protein